MAHLSTAEKLEALMLHAQKAGYHYGDEHMSMLTGYTKPRPVGSIQFYDGKLSDVMHVPYQAILFNHDFARALFGEEEDGTELLNGVYGEQPKRRMHYHLQQAVISDDPVSYMYKEVFGDQVL